MKRCETYPWRAPLHVGEYPCVHAIILRRRTCSWPLVCLTWLIFVLTPTALNYMYGVLWNVPLAFIPACWWVPTSRTHSSIAHVFASNHFAPMYMQLAFNLLYLCSFLFSLVQYLIIGMECCETYPWRSPLHVGEYPPRASIRVSLTCLHAIILRRRTCSWLYLLDLSLLVVYRLWMCIVCISHSNLVLTRTVPN